MPFASLGLTGVDVGQHAAGGDGYLAQQLAELLVVADGQLDVARNDAASGASKLKNVSGGTSGNSAARSYQGAESAQPQRSTIFASRGAGRVARAHRVFLLSRAAFPASSSTSAARYSSTAAR